MSWRSITKALSTHTTPRRLQRYDTVLNHRVKNVRVVVENASDPHNAAACVRTAEGFGLHHFHVIESYNTYSTAKSITRGTHNWITLHRHRSPEDLVSHLRADKFLILTSVIDESSQDLATLLPRLPPNQPLALVFGSEERGASQYMRVAADHRFMLPMRGFVESFNLSVSVGLSLQTCRLLDRLVPDLTEDEKVEQKARWLMNDTRNAKLVLQRYNIPIPPDF